MTLPEYAPDSSTLPAYESSVFLEAELECKLEWVSPTRRNFSRRWFRANLELNNTQLTITPLGYGGGARRVLSMQYAEIGVAGDYRKGIYPIRLRAEGMQYLFECRELFVALQWIQAIELSVGISLPLELREEPKALYKKAHRIGSNRKSKQVEPEYHKDAGDCESIGSSNDSLWSASSDIDHRAKNDDAMIVLGDIPKNMTFRLCDFGIIYNKQQWALPFEMTY